MVKKRVVASAKSGSKTAPAPIEEGLAARTERIMVYVTPEYKKRFIRAANDKCLGLSSWVVLACIEAVTPKPSKEVVE